MNYIESRKRPEIDVAGQPYADTVPVFRLPLPPTRQIVNSALPLFVWGLLIGVLIAVGANVHKAAPLFVTIVLAGCALINFFASVVRHFFPHVQMAALFHIGGVIIVCGVFLEMLKGGLFNPEATVTLIGTGIVAFLLATYGGYLVWGKTTLASFGWGAGFLSLLIAIMLPCKITLEIGYYALFAPVLMANVALVLSIGDGLARYHLADPRLTQSQVALGEKLRKSLWENINVNYVAAASFVLYLPVSQMIVPQVFSADKNPDLLLRVLPVALPSMLAAIMVSWPFLPWTAHRYLPLTWMGHLLWFGYDNNVVPTAGVGTFSFPAIISSVSRRRAIYGATLVANVITVRFLWAGPDLRVSEYGLAHWLIYLPSFFVPLIIPFGFTAALHGVRLVKLEKETHEVRIDA
jgi:hypothetical protein